MNAKRRSILAAIISLAFVAVVMVSLFASPGSALNRRWYRYQMEPETLTYAGISGVSLTQAQLAAVDANIKAIKYGSGITLSSLTAKRSEVDGTAFVTQSSVDLRPYVGFKLTTSDGGVGWLSAAGTVEGLGGEIVDAWTNNATTPYETFTPGAGNLITSAINTTTVGICYKASTVASGALLRLVHNITVNSGSAIFIVGTNTSLGDPKVLFTAGATANETVYKTASAATHVGYWSGAGAGNFSTSAFSLKTVTAPSSSGALIVNAKSGATRNWAAKGTTPNAATFTYTITRE